MAGEETIGERIAMRRQELGMKQAELAKLLGVHKATVTSWETGKSYPKRHLGAIEAQLRVNLRDTPRVSHYDTPDEALIWSLDRFTEDERRALIAALRDRRGAARHALEPPGPGTPR
jgi:transcriptional regulator with XRE-family HTH domain